MQTQERISDHQIVFPGENWFFYWKTSASLWQTKLEQMPATSIIIPINWALHSDDGIKYDFGQERAETDLHRLYRLILSLGREVFFYLPLTPAPFLPNGGIPHLLARVPSINRSGMLWAFQDQEMRLNKLYSFFDSRIYQAYRKFLSALGAYFNEWGQGVSFWGINCGVLEDDRFVSCLEDQSKIFDQAFGRFLVTRQQDVQTEQEAKAMIASVEEEARLRFQFQESIRELYLESAKEFLGHNWEGALDIVFLGGDQADFFARALGFDHVSKNSRDFLNSLQMDIVPSSVLLSPAVKNGILQTQFADLAGDDFLKLRMNNDSIAQEELGGFLPLVLFEVYGAKKVWNNSGLMSILDEYFAQAFKRPSFELIQQRLQAETFSPDKVFFFHAADITESRLKILLRIFMEGGKIILNRAGIIPSVQKKMELFYLENNLQVEFVRKNVSLHASRFGEGELIVYDGEELEKLELERKRGFWQDLIASCKITHLRVDREDGIEFSWRTRFTGANELNYEEVRRLYMYNPTSYKKKAKIQWGNTFALMKMKENKVFVNNSPNQLKLEFPPMGTLWIEFGRFSE